MGLSIELGVIWAQMPLSLYLVGVVVVRITFTLRRRCFTQAKSVGCVRLGGGVCEICAGVSIHLTPQTYPFTSRRRVEKPVEELQCEQMFGMYV